MDELRIKTDNEMSQELEIIQEIEDIVSQEKMTPSKCTIVMTKLNLLRSLANSSNDIQNVRDLLLDFADYSENDKTSEATDECVDNYLDQKQ